MTQVLWDVLGVSLSAHSVASISSAARDEEELDCDSLLCDTTSERLETFASLLPEDEENRVKLVRTRVNSSNIVGGCGKEYE